MGLVTRQIGPNAKGSKLTFIEMDNNLYYLQGLGVSGLTYSAGTLTTTNPCQKYSLPIHGDYSPKHCRLVCVFHTILGNCSHHPEMGHETSQPDATSLPRS